MQCFIPVAVEDEYVRLSKVYNEIGASFTWALVIGRAIEGRKLCLPFCE